MVYIYRNLNYQMKGFYWADCHVGSDVWYFSACLFLKVALESYISCILFWMIVTIWVVITLSIYSKQLINCVKCMTTLILSDVSSHSCCEMPFVSATVFRSHIGNTSIISDHSYADVDMHDTNLTNTLSDPPEVSSQQINANYCHSPTSSSELLTLIRDP